MLPSEKPGQLAIEWKNARKTDDDKRLYVDCVHSDYALIQRL